MKLKKFTAAILGMCMAFSMSAGYGVNAVDMGDVTENGSVDTEDALAILNHVVGNKILSAEQQKLADIDGNGAIDSVDALSLLQCVVGVKPSVYEKFIGKYTGYFGDEKTAEYTGGDLTIKSFSLSIESIEGNTVKGNIYMNAYYFGMNQEKKSNFTSEIKDGVMNIVMTDSDKIVSIDTDFFFSGNELTGTINKASVMGELYSFPTVYFEKS